MKRLALIVAFCWLTLEARAQKFPSEMWHEGKVVLESGDTLRGDIMYNMQNDVIQLNNKVRLESFSARKVIFFEIFDQLSRRYRQFYSLPYAAMGGYRAPVFFELLTEGKVTLLCRESVELRSYSSSFYYYGSSSRMVLVYKYFILTEKGDIETFSGKKSDLMDLVGNYADQIQKFIKVNKLDIDEKYDMAQIFEYYNSLFR